MSDAGGHPRNLIMASVYVGEASLDATVSFYTGAVDLSFQCARL